MHRASSIVLLGAFEFNPHTGVLSRAGRRIHLPAQSARLLALLVNRSGEVVTREEIRLALWGADTHVEFDAAVNACISQIRTALGDSARAPRFIETLPRLGYRCLVEVAKESALTVEAKAAPKRVPLAQAVGATIGLILAVSALVWLAGDQRRRPSSRSLVAMQKFERGISGLADAGPAELVDRVKHFETAIAADANFAAAYAGLAEAKLLIGTYRVEPPQVAYASAKAAAQRALTLEPNLADAHAVYGAALLFFEWDWLHAGHHLRRAVALNPRSARVQLWMSRFLTAAGEHDGAVAAARQAVTLAPGSPSALTTLGIAHYYARHYADARNACNDALAVMREFVPAHTCLQAAEAGTSRSPNPLLATAVDLVRNGDRELALDWLQRAANRHSDSLIFAAVEPGLESLRDDPRFGGVLMRIGRHPN